MDLFKMTRVDALRTVALSHFRPFEDGDWDAFQGCQTENPLIAEIDDNMLVVVDGKEVTFVQNNRERTFRMGIL